MTSLDSFRASPQTPPSKVVLWIIWTAIFAGVFMMRHFLSPVETERPATPANQQTIALAFLLSFTFASLAIRILWVPRVPERGKALVAMIVGLSLAESLTIHGIFFAPGHRDVLFATSVALIVVYIPLFIRVEAPATDAGDTSPR